MFVLLPASGGFEVSDFSGIRGVRIEKKLWCFGKRGQWFPAPRKLAEIWREALGLLLVMKLERSSQFCLDLKGGREHFSF